MLRRLELSKEMHHELIEYSKRKEIEFLSTGFDIESLKFLNELGLRFFKIPSGEITNLPYLRYIGSLGKPIVLSTGMSTLHEIRDALEILEVSGTPRNKVTVLHCNTEYPTPIEDVNLNAMTKIRDTLDVKVGYSDHTLGIEVSTAAVALGASIIEKHLTMNRNLPGPDHLASLEPKEFEAMVKSIKNIEKAMGDGIKIPSPSEEKNIVIARKSLVAKKSIYAGEEFTPYNVTTKRPGNGISPMNWDKAMGQIAPRDFIEDELIEL
jgi:N,N'-diacetyllegionaminate synthase